MKWQIDLLATNCPSFLQNVKLFQLKSANLRLKIVNINIPDKPHCNYLAVHLDPQLIFRGHISYVAKQLNKVCGILYRVRYMYPKKYLSIFYNTYSKTIISYDLLICGRDHKINLESIDHAQRRVFKTILFQKSLTARGMFTNKRKFFQFRRCSILKFFANY